MPKGKTVNWKKFEKFLEYSGCVFIRERGDHRIYRRDGIKRPIVIPRYDPVPVFIIRNCLKLLNIPWKEFLNILDKI